MAIIIVIGAGFSGLQAAATLTEAGHSVRVLEARDRLGGRTRLDSITAANGHSQTVDVGGQWIGAAHNRLRRLAQDAGATILPQHTAGKNLLHVCDKLKRYSGEIPFVSPLALLELQLAINKLSRLEAQLDIEAPWAAKNAAAWDRETLDSWLRRQLRSRAGREIFHIAVRAVLTTEPAGMSFLQFLFYCRSNGGFATLIGTSGGAQAEVIAGGMPQLATFLSRRLARPVQLNEPVLAVTQHAGGVTVRTKNGSYEADRLVISIPPALLGQIDFQPALPVARARLTQQMPMGSVIKAVISYARPFWRENGLSGEASSHSLPFNTVFDASWPTDRGAALVGFFDGQRALDYADARPAERQQAVIDSLAFYFGEQARNNLGYVDYNWLQDPWAKGCYVGVMTPGTMTTLGHTLRVPVGRVHWAGTETAAQWCGYIEGALTSGERAAAEIIAAS